MGQVVREWLVAFGTIGATFVAVYVGVLRERWRRPKLSLEYGGPSNGDAVEAHGENRWVGAYVRLRVTAAKRRYAAEDVEVMVLGARELEAREGNPPASGGIAIDGQLLGWSNTESTRMTIPSDTHRHLDLLHIIKAETASGAAPAWIAVRPVYNDGRNSTKKRDVRVGACGECSQCERTSLQGRGALRRRVGRRPMAPPCRRRPDAAPMTYCFDTLRCADGHDREQVRHRSAVRRHTRAKRQGEVQRVRYLVGRSLP